MLTEPALVEVYVTPVQTACMSVLALLSAAERQRLAEMRSSAARDQFTSTRACLRTVLSQRLGCAPQAVAISVSPGAAPIAPGTGWHFSLSHASAYGVVALSRSGPLGVDIEADHPVQDALQIARTVLHPSECDWISRHGRDTQSAAFLRVWVRKEAVAKANGQGLAQSLASWSVLTPLHGLGTVVDLECRQQVWRVHELKAPPGHFVALAAACRDADVELRQLVPQSFAGWL